MNETLKIGKRALTIAVAATTILWTVGVAALVAPTAQAVEAGDLIKGETLSTVYYYAEDGQRYIFPTEKTYFSWYEDFSGVTTISDEELADIDLGGNVVYRAGSRWVKIDSVAKTYAVTPDGVIRWIETEEVAEGLAGEDWNQFVDDVPDVYWGDYTEGTSLMDASEAYEGALVSGSTYLISGGEKRLVTDDGMTANGFQTRFLLDGTGVDLDAMDAGDDVEAYEGSLSDTAQVNEDGATEEPDGDLTLSVATDTAAAVSIPADADSVAFFSFDVAGTGTLDSLIFNLGGVGATTNLSNAYIYEDMTRVTDGRSINASTRQVTFTNLNLDVDGTRTFTLRVDIPSSPDAGDTANISIASADSVGTDAAVSGTFPLTGNTMTFASASAGSVTITKNGNPANPSIGEDGATISKINIAASSEDASIQSLTFTVKKASDHSNYELYQNSDLLGTGTVTDNLVSFDLSADPFEIEEGSSRNFEMRADIGGDSADTLKVTIPEDTDLMAVGSDFGFNMSVDNTAYDSSAASCTSTSSECSYLVLQGGQLTLTFNGPDTGDIAQGGRDVTLLEFTLTAEEYMTIKDFDIRVGSDDDGDGTMEWEGTEADDSTTDTDGLYNSATAVLSDISIRYADSGSVLMGPQELSTATVTAALDEDQLIEFTNDFTMEAGESLDLLVTADVYASAVSEDYAVRIDVSGVEAEDANGDTVSDVVPSSDITGNTLTVQTPTVTITKTTPPGNGTYVKGATDVDFVGWSFAASAASDIEITDLTVYVISDSDVVGDTDLDGDAIATPADHISTCSLYDGLTGTLVDGPESFDTTSDYATFSSFSWTVEAGESGQMLVTCNLANVALDSGVAQNDGHFIYISATAGEAAADTTSQVTAVDEDGDSPTITVTTANRNYNSSPTTSNVTYQTVTTADTVTLAASSDRPLAGIILGDSTDVLMNKVKATVVGYEAATITKITFENDTDDDNAADASTASSSVKISYEDENGDTQTKTGYLSAGTVTFSNIDWYVPISGASYLEVYADINEVGVSGTSSGTELDLDLDTTGGSSLYSYNGESSGTTTTTVTGTAEGNGMFVYNSKPTLSLASGSPSGSGIPGLNEVFRFNVSADSRGDIGVDEFTFVMSSTDNGTMEWNYYDTANNGQDDDGVKPGIAESELTLYDLDAPSVAIEAANANWIFYESDGTACVDDSDCQIDWIVLDLGTPDTVAAGDTITYSMYLDTTGASASNDDSIRIDLPADTTVSSFSGTDPDGTMIWDDTNGYGSNTDIDGTYLSLPVIGGTIVY